MLVNIVKHEDGSYTVDKHLRGLPGYDVSIADKAYRRLRKNNTAFDMIATTQLEFMYIATQASSAKAKPEAVAVTPVERPVIAPERPPWRDPKVPHVEQTGIHHRKRKVRPALNVIPFQVSGDRARSTWDPQRFASIIDEEPAINPFWNEDCNNLTKRLNRIKPGHCCSDKHIMATGDLMPPARWLMCVASLVDGRMRWAGRVSDKATDGDLRRAEKERNAAFALFMEASIELMTLTESLPKQRSK